MDEQRLNKKLAEYFGMVERREVVNTGREDEEYKDEAYFLAETGERITFNLIQVGFYAGFLPLTQSLDACFKWLVPKLQFETITFVPVTGTATELDSIQKWGCKILHRGWRKTTSAIGLTSTLALCLAIEKLIDSP